MELPPEHRSFDLKDIVKDLIDIDILEPRIIGKEILNRLSLKLSTDRISLTIVDNPTGTIVLSETIGLDISPETEMTAGKLITKALGSKEPLVFKNIRQHPDLTAMWANDYRTNACAVLPLFYRQEAIGALCIANLTEEQVVALQVQPKELKLFNSLAAMLTIIFLTNAPHNGNERVNAIVERLKALK